jgi:hypothetical protein
MQDAISAAMFKVAGDGAIKLLQAVPQPTL